MNLSSSFDKLVIYESKVVFIKSTNLYSISLISFELQIFSINFFSKIKLRIKFEVLLYITLFKHTLKRN